MNQVHHFVIRMYTNLNVNVSFNVPPCVVDSESRDDCKTNGKREIKSLSSGFGRCHNRGDRRLELNLDHFHLFLLYSNRV